VAILYSSDYGFSDRLSQTLARGITKAGVKTEMVDMLSVDPQVGGCAGWCREVKRRGGMGGGRVMFVCVLSSSACYLYPRPAARPVPCTATNPTTHATHFHPYPWCFCAP
jgi:hypothetical protein